MFKLAIHQMVPVSCLVLIGLLATVATEQSVAEEKWVGHHAYQWTGGENRSFGRLSWFNPILQSKDSLLFANVLAQYDDHDSRGLNLGLGYRRLYDGWIIGGWGYADWYKKPSGNDFIQFNFGVEALSDKWDYRFNAYIPANNAERLRDRDFVETTASTIAVRLGEERALSGADIEVGYRVPLFDETRIYFGGFHYDASDFDGLTGPKFRIESRFHQLPFLGKRSRITVGAEVSNDSERNTFASGFVRLRVPLGGAARKAPALSSIERRMTDSVVREFDIQTHSGISGPRQAFNALTGQPIEGLVTLDASDNDNIHEIVSSNPDNTLFVVDGTVENNQTIFVNEGHSFVGGGSPVSVGFFESNGGGFGSLDFTPAGTPGVVIGTVASNNVFVVPPNATAANFFQNLTISGGRDGISDTDDGLNSQNIFLQSVVIENVTGHAIDIDDIANLTLNNVDIRGVGSRGINSGSNNVIRISNSRFSDIDDVGIRLGNRSLLFITDNSELNNIGDIGLSMGQLNRVLISDSTITDTGKQNILINSNGNALTINHADLSNAGSGLAVINTGSDNTLTLNDVDIANVGGAGVFINNNSNVSLVDVRINGATDGVQIATDTTATFTRLDIFDASESGLAIEGTGNDVTFTGGTIARSGDDGIVVATGNNTLNLSDIDIMDSGASGVRIQDDNNVTINHARILRSSSFGVLSFRGNDIALTDVLIEDTGMDGIRATGINFGPAPVTLVPSSLTLDNVTVRDANGDALRSYSNTLVIDGLIVENSGAAGINLVNRENDLTLNRSSFTNIGTDTLLIDGDDTVLSGSDNTEVAPVGGVNCNVSGVGASGSIGFTSVAGGGSGSCQ